MHFVAPFAGLDCGLSRSSGKYARHRRSCAEQMRQKAMLFKQPLRIAHRPVMALNEDPSAARSHNAGC